MLTEQDRASRAFVPAGKVVFEVFQDFTPLPARTFVNRCRPGSTSTLLGTQVHKVLPGLGIYMGLNPK